jgi:lambda family phage minor tail protein L
MATFNEQVLSLTPKERVDLFKVDLSHIDGPALYFTPNREALTPAEVERLGDQQNAQTGSYRLYDNDGFFDDATVVHFECYVRLNTGEGTPVFRLEEDGSNRGDLRYNLNNNSTHTQTTGNIAGVKAAATVASEYIFLSGTFTKPTGNTIEFFELFAAGGTYAGFPTFDVQGQATLDIFGLRVWKDIGGLRIPWIKAMNASFSNWEQRSGADTAQIVANTFEAIKTPIWGGQVYTATPIRAQGFDHNGNGAFPKPTLSMSNLGGAASLLEQQYGDVRGATVTRTRVFGEHLDNGLNPDPLASFTPDVFTLARKSLQNGQIVEYELSSRIDQQGVKLPRRQVLRDVCPWKYRVWDATANGGAGAFDYTNVECPYTDPEMYDLNGDAVVDPTEDKCSRKLDTGCRARFGTSQELPYGGFPMVGRFRR